MTQPLDWWPATRDVLGAEGDIEVPRITQPSWVVLDMSFWGVTERYGKKPWNHWMPADAAHPGWNKITLYRKRKVSDGDLGYFQMIRGWFTFWEGGEQSPARQSQDLVNKSEATIASIANNPFLDAETFYRAAHLFYEVANWLMNTGRPAILDVVGQVDQDASGFQGSAADAFVFAMEDFAAAMLFLKENITEPTDWIELLNDNGDAVNAFKSAMQSAWSAFKDYHYYDPNWLLLDLVRSMEQQIDAYDAEVSQFEVTSDSNESWNFSFPEQGLPGPYNLLWGDEWVRLNADLKSTWTNKMVELDAAARTATQTLVDSYNTTMQSMQRGVLPLHKTAFPVQVDDPLAAAGGGDFPGGGDFGGGDFGGGGDFAGGGDFGGGDFAGGGDFPGGGDFAGGGDFPGGGDFAGGGGGPGLGSGRLASGGGDAGGFDTGAGFDSADFGGGGGGGGDAGAGSDFGGARLATGGDFGGGGPGGAGPAAVGDGLGGLGVGIGADGSGGVEAGFLGGLGPLPGSGLPIRSATDPRDADTTRRAAGAGDGTFDDFTAGADFGGVQVPGGPADDGSAGGLISSGFGPGGVRIPADALGSAGAVGSPGAGFDVGGVDGSSGNGSGGFLTDGFGGEVRIPGTAGAGGPGAGFGGGFDVGGGAGVVEPGRGVGGSSGSVSDGYAIGDLGGGVRLPDASYLPGAGSAAVPDSGAIVGPFGTPPPGYAGPDPSTDPVTRMLSAAQEPGAFVAVGGQGIDNLLPLSAQPGAAGAAGVSNSAGYGFPPFMPPMGGLGAAGGQQAEKERERTTWLAEEEEVWGTDPDCAPAVVGRDDAGTPGERTQRPLPPRTPGSPNVPTRSTTRIRT